MSNLADSMAQAPTLADSAQSIAGWKAKVGAAVAIVLGLFWILFGGWKALSPYEFGAMVTRLHVNQDLSVPFSSLLGTGEILGGLMLLIPRFRRWGAWLTGALLVGFMLYMGINYSELKGEDCSCFKWLERTVSPEFFWEDGAMLAATALAGVWAARSSGFKKLAMMGVGVGAFSLASLAYNASLQTGTPAPASIKVDGKDYGLKTGKTLVFFFDPQCTHCLHSAEMMGKYKFDKAVRVVMAPIRVGQFTGQFLEKANFKPFGAVDEKDTPALRETFHLAAPDPPNGVAIENGRVKKTWTAWDDNEPEKSLREMKWID